MLDIIINIKYIKPTQQAMSCRSTSAVVLPLGYYLEGNTDRRVCVKQETPTEATIDLLVSLLNSNYAEDIDVVGQWFYYAARHIKTGRLIEWQATINTNHGRIVIMGNHHRIHIIV